MRVKHLNKGGFLACRQRPEVKCSLLVRYSTKNQDPLFLPRLLQRSPLNRSGEWEPLCSREPPSGCDDVRLGRKVIA